MSKQDFIALADAIIAHQKRGDHQNPFKADQIEALADFCAGQNSRFNRQRWLDYIDGKCGPSGGVRLVVVHRKRQIDGKCGPNGGVR